MWIIVYVHSHVCNTTALRWIVHLVVLPLVSILSVASAMKLCVFFITSSLKDSLFYQIAIEELNAFPANYPSKVPHFHVKFRRLLTSPPRLSKMKFHLVGVKRPNNFFHVFLPRDSSQGSSLFV